MYYLMKISSSTWLFVLIFLSKLCTNSRLLHSYWQLWVPSSWCVTWICTLVTRSLELPFSQNKRLYMVRQKWLDKYFCWLILDTQQSTASWNANVIYWAMIHSIQSFTMLLLVSTLISQKFIESVLQRRTATDNRWNSLKVSWRFRTYNCIYIRFYGYQKQC